jgi:hypothetical protein
LILISGSDSGGSFVLALVLFAVIAIAAGIGGILVQRRRREGMQQWADSHGFSFEAGDTDDVMVRLQSVPLFQRGRRQRAYNTIRGRLDAFHGSVSVVMGDYSYVETQGSGENKRNVTRRFSYAMVVLPFDTPSVSLRTETFLDRFAGALGFDDIDFESAEFSERFHVKASDRRFAYDLIHPRMMEHLLAATYPGFVLDSGLLVMTSGTRTWEVLELETVLRELRSLLTLWPQHLLPTSGV